MGKVEKVVVLSVLFLIAVILVVSLTVDDPLDKEKVTLAGNPGQKTAVLPQAQKPAQSPGMVPLQSTDTLAQNSAAAPAPVVAANAPVNTPNANAPSALLSATVQTTPEPIAASNARSAIPSGSILKTSEGLTDSYLPEMKFYTWQSGDSLRSIATKYYGDATKLTILRRSNEGRQDVQPGEKILIPVFDGDAPVAMEAAPASGKPVEAAAPKLAGAKDASGPRTHVVKDGESLWKIAKQELGSGARWKEIFEANRDVLATADAVHTGMRLRIP